jgi:hypothetical protein
MLTHSTCTGVSGSVAPAAIATSSVNDSPPLTGSRKVMALRRLSQTVRPSSTA